MYQSASIITKNLLTFFFHQLNGNIGQYINSHLVLYQSILKEMKTESEIVLLFRSDIIERANGNFL